MMVEKTQLLDARDLLRGVNGVVALLMLLAYPMFQDARYVNGLTLLLGLALALLVHSGLSKRRTAVDPFVVVLLYYVTTYYTLRVVTLSVFDTSDVFRRFPYGPQDTNYALTFIIACNVSMLCGFGLMQKQGSMLSHTLLGWRNACNVQIFLRTLHLVLLLSVIGGVTGALDWISEFRILRVLSFFLQPTTLLILAGSYLVVFYHETPKRYFVSYFAQLLVVMSDLIMQGSRGQIVYFIEIFALILIANEHFRFSRQWVSRGLKLTPLLLLVLVLSYNFATLQRSNNGKEEGRQLAVALDNLYGAITNGDGVNDFMGNIGHIFSRVGYLDLSAEVIAHKQQYGSIFSASYYAKSFVDNVLTPGFDVFDTPKVAYSMIFKYQNLNQGVPSKSYLLENNVYNSDQLGIYGEMYALFGWYSLLLLFLFAYSLKWGYYNLRFSENRYEEVVKRLLILVFFINFINSFGVDWMVVQTIPFILTAALLIFYLRSVVSAKPNEASV
jgi:hypothetical protein